MAEILHQQILNDVSGGMLYVTGGKISYVNPAIEKIFGKTADTLLNQSFAKIFVDYAENDDFNQIFIDAIEDFSRKHENIVQYFDGKNFKYLHMKTSILYDGQKKMGMLIMIDDITEVLKLCGVELTLQKIKEMNAQLETQKN